MLGLVFIFGLIMGSFFMVVGTRLSKNESIVKPGSHCPKCQHQLKWYELIPVVSYVIQKGKCRQCKCHISIIYPVVELLTAGLYTACFYKYGFSFDFYTMLIISSLLIIIYVSDFKYFIILDEPLILGSVFYIFLCLGFQGFDFAMHSIICGLLLFIIMYAIKLIGDKVFKRESLGGGDIKLSFLIGLFLGFKLSLTALVLASFLALPVAIYYLFVDKEREIPFGPFLITSTFLIYLFSFYVNNFINYLFYI